MGAAARRCASVQTTHLYAFLTISTSPDAQIARSDEYGTFTWEEPSTPTPYDESNGRTMVLGGRSKPGQEGKPGQRATASAKKGK